MATTTTQYKLMEARFQDENGNEVTLSVDDAGNYVAELQEQPEQKKGPATVVHGSFMASPLSAGSQTKSTTLAYRLCGPYYDSAGHPYFIPC